MAMFFDRSRTVSPSLMSSSKSQSSKFFLRRLDVYQHASEQTDTHMFKE